MTTRKLNLLLTAVFLAIVSNAIAARAQGRVYDFRDVKAPGAIQTDSYAVNQYGVIAGDYVDAHNIQHGMILNGNQLTTFDLQGCQTTANTVGSIAAFAINNLGTVAGWCLNANKLAIAFTYANGIFTAVAFPGASGTEATGINDNGEVVGTYFKDRKQHGFYLIGTTYTTIDIPHIGSTTAWGVNNVGLITLFGPNAKGTSVSYTFDGTTFKQYKVPNAGHLGTVIQTPNNNHDLLFTWFDNQNAGHGAWFHHGAYLIVKDPKGPNSTRANGLSDALVSGRFKGQVEIVGRYSPGILDPASTPPNAGYSAIGCCRGDAPR